MKYSHSLILALIFYLNAFPVFSNNNLTSREALDIFKKKSTISNVVIIGDFDVSLIPKIKTEQETAIFNNVTFKGTIISSKKEVNVPLTFIDCRINTLYITKCKIKREFKFLECLFNNVIIENNDFQKISFENGTINLTFSARNSTFYNTAKFLDCKFLFEKSDFSSTIFHEVADFRDSKFNNLNFSFSSFLQTFWFMNTQVVNTVDLQGSYFQGDALFSYSDFGQMKFGKITRITTFESTADFRHAKFNKAFFDFVEFKSKASFDQVEITDSASFKNANFSDNKNSFYGLNCEGPLNFEHAILSNIDFYWKELEEPIIKADPSTETLNYFYKRSKELGRENESFKVFYLYKKKMKDEVLSSSGTSFIDKLMIWLEWLTWGYPASYGTNIIKAVCISLLFWFLFTLPLIYGRPRIKKIHMSFFYNSKYEKYLNNRRLYESINIESLPEDYQGKKSVHYFKYLAKIINLYFYTFSTIFKVKTKLVLIENSRNENFYYEIYLQFMWLLGWYFISLMALTLFNISPLLKYALTEIV